MVVLALSRGITVALISRCGFASAGTALDYIAYHGLSNLRPDAPAHAMTMYTRLRAAGLFTCQTHWGGSRRHVSYSRCTVVVLFFTTLHDSCCSNQTLIGDPQSTLGFQGATVSEVSGRWMLPFVPSHSVKCTNSGDLCSIIFNCRPLNNSIRLHLPSCCNAS